VRGVWEWETNEKPRRGHSCGTHMSEWRTCVGMGNDEGVDGNENGKRPRVWEMLYGGIGMGMRMVAEPGMGQPTPYLLNK
jgi:hypothetical protein